MGKTICNGRIEWHVLAATAAISIACGQPEKIGSTRARRKKSPACTAQFSDEKKMKPRITSRSRAEPDGGRDAPVGVGGRETMGKIICNGYIE